MLLHEIMLVEVAKPTLNLDYLEQRYKTLSAKLKEVLPANIKEWQNFQKQIDNLWNIYLKVKEADMSWYPPATMWSGQWNIYLRGQVLQDMPFKHSLPEAVTLLESKQKDNIMTYFFHGGFDITQYPRIFGMAKTHFQKIKDANTKSDRKQQMQQLVAAATEEVEKTGNITIAYNFKPELLMQLARKTAPKTLTFTADYTTISDAEVDAINRFKTLKLIKGPLTGQLDDLNVIVDTVFIQYYHNLSLPKQYHNVIVDAAPLHKENQANFLKQVITQASGHKITVLLAAENDEVTQLVKQNSLVTIKYINKKDVTPTAIHPNLGYPNLNQ